MITRSRFHRRSAKARCMEVRRVINAFVDAQVEPRFAVKIAEHLEDCRRCGLSAEVYARIKESLQASRPTIDDEAIARLREFGSGLGEHR